MQLDDVFNVSEFRKNLIVMRQFFQKGMEEDQDHPEEVGELVEAMGRLEQELANQKSQQFLSDFFLVHSFLNSVDEDDDEDEDDNEDL
jgi:pyrroloquinoline quinone (PQQ) biosynthesis protein C